MEEIKIKSKHIKLDQFLKWANLVATGGEAKLLIKAGEITVNGEIEYKRGKKIKAGDIIVFKNKSYKVIKN